MASEEIIPEYERKRLQNIKRNGEMFAALNIHSKASDLSAATKRQRVGTKVNPQKKVKPQTPIAFRRSQRTRMIAQASKVLSDDSVDKTSKSVFARDLGPLSFKEAVCASTRAGSDKALIDTILSSTKKPQVGCISAKEDDKSSFDLGSLTLKPGNIGRLGTRGVTTVMFSPFTNVRMVVAGCTNGDIGFWNMDSKQEEDDGVYLYHAHTCHISGISIQQSKIFTSCNDGIIRLMDAEKEVFDLVYECDYTISSLSHQPNNANALYFSEGGVGLNIWDVRAGKSSAEWLLHEDDINSIDFNSRNPNIMATGSSDGTACLWDLRSMASYKPLKVAASHSKAVQSAYFSPSGTSLATTGYDNMVGIWSGVNFEDTSMIYHYNPAHRRIPSFKAIWGWDDSFVFIGNMQRGVTVISTAQTETIANLHSPYISAIPCRFHVHPCEVGTLAGATSGGQVYVWTSD